MKPSLKGNLEELYANKAYKIRILKTGKFVEFVRKVDTRQWSTGRLFYEIGICGINANGIPCAAYFEPGVDKAYFWQYADKTASKEILENPQSAYDWKCVKNGIRNKV